MPDLGALLTAIVTPFHESKPGDPHPAVDEQAFVRLHQHLCANGSDGIVACGTTGEASTLSDDEHLRVIQLAVENKPQGTTVIGGTGSNDTREACFLTERATELGVDAVLVVTPYYNRPNRRGLVRHFQEVSRATDKPILLYNIPFRTGTDMPNDLLAELAQIDGVVGVKQANDNNLASVEGLALYSGNDDTFIRALEHGAAGLISVASHLVGPQLQRMISEPDQREAIHRELTPLFAALTVTNNPIPVKAALALQGHIENVLRLPMVPTDEHETRVVRSALEELALLPTGAHA
jgi:4-hydroxy-tetrahydrodipicolinate synthase